MRIEKVWVEEFEFLENNGELGISMQLEAEPIDLAELVYDGRNCAILIRNNTKAYLFTNIIPDIRQKLMNAEEIMMIEQKGEEIINAYQVAVRKVDTIPYEDTLTDTLAELMHDLKAIYGTEGLERIVKGMQEETNA